MFSTAAFRRMLCSARSRCRFSSTRRGRGSCRRPGSRARGVELVLLLPRPRHEDRGDHDERDHRRRNEAHGQSGLAPRRERGVFGLRHDHGQRIIGETVRGGDEGRLIGRAHHAGHRRIRVGQRLGNGDGRGTRCWVRSRRAREHSAVLTQQGHAIALAARGRAKHVLEIGHVVDARATPRKRPSLARTGRARIETGIPVAKPDKGWQMYNFKFGLALKTAKYSRADRSAVSSGQLRELVSRMPRRSSTASVSIGGSSDFFSARKKRRRRCRRERLQSSGLAVAVGQRPRSRRSFTIRSAAATPTIDRREMDEWNEDAEGAEQAGGIEAEDALRLTAAAIDGPADT